jgi:hypothetical protein
MEKNEMPIAGASDIAADASAAAPVQAPAAASNVATGASAAGASAAAPVAASNVAAGASAAGASAAAPVQAPVAWDPYEPVSYVAPENPYDTSIIDDEPEVTLCSLVLIPFQSFCVRSYVIRVRLFLVLDLTLLVFVICFCL